MFGNTMQNLHCSKINDGAKARTGAQATAQARAKARAGAKAEAIAQAEVWKRLPTLGPCFYS